MLRRILSRISWANFVSYVRGDSYYSPEDSRTEITMADGTKQTVQPGDVIEKKSGKTFAINNHGMPVLINDPSFKHAKLADTHPEHPDLAVIDRLTVAAVALLVVIAGVVLMLVGASIA